jgi:hypothetical protein
MIQEHEEIGCCGYRLRTIKDEDDLVSAEGGPSRLYGGLRAREHADEIGKAVRGSMSDDDFVAATKLSWSPVRQCGPLLRGLRLR